MHSINKPIGDYGEHLAELYLTDLGYIILDKNFRCKLGEIDLIGKDGDYITFIEVKTRRTTCFGMPCEAVNFVKQNKILKTAQMYILKKKLNKYNFRFDVVEIILNNNVKNYSIRLIKNAFQM